MQQPHKRLPPAFGWVGGKTKLSKDIVQLMPAHSLYIEVFGGALSVLYAKPKFKLPRYREVVNDINGELINLHRMIQTRPESLSQTLSRLLISREIFYKLKQGVYKPRSDIERAAYYYYLLTQSFGAKGENFAMSAKTRRPKDIYKGFDVWSQRLRFVTIENMPFEHLIKTYNRDEALFYCDPPYVGTEHYYKNMPSFGIEEHIKLRDTLASSQGKFLLSYNDCDVVRDLYKDFNIIQSKDIVYTLHATSYKSVKEVYITNYDQEKIKSG